MRTLSIVGLLVSFGIGCDSESIPDDGDSGSSEDISSVDSGGHSGESGDTTNSDDTGDGPMGLRGRIGTAMVDETSFVGTEELYFRADYGQGSDICRIRYSLTSTDLRTDCTECEWAFDLVVGDVELVTESEPGCLATVGVEGSVLETLDQSVVSYGYNPDYFGHIQVLFAEQEGVWGPVDNGDWDRNTGEFVYDWQDGYMSY